jgi:hypothetical protein
MINLKVLSLTFFSLIFYFSPTWAQENLELVVEWEKPLETNFNGKPEKFPRIKNQGYENSQPNYYWAKELDSKKSYLIELTSYETSNCDEVDLNFLKKYPFIVPEKFMPELVVRNGGAKKYAVTNFYPYIMENGTVKRIASLSVELSITGNSKPVIAAKTFKGNSVLKDGSGIWYKIAVTADGIYKIDKAFLESIGISTVNLNPNDINIFGNGEGMLPEDNSIHRTDDLAKNAIQIIGDSDGSFDENDYILFYGWGPHRWFANGTSQFDRKTNVYEDNSYYFININANDIPLRMSALNSSTAAPTHFVNEMDVRMTYENDLTNLVKGGQRWYGDLFDVTLSRNYNYSIPNIVSSSPLRFKAAFGGNGKDSSSDKISISIGGENLLFQTIPLAGADYSRNVFNFIKANPSSSFSLNISVARSNPSVVAYLDFITLNARRSLNFYGNELSFTDLSSVGAGNVGRFTLSNSSSGIFIWDITNRQQPKIIQTSLSGSNLEFTVATDTIKEFVASNGQSFLSPIKIESVSYQNIHGLAQADYLIVSPSQFISQANRLADLHRSEGMSVHVVNQAQIFNEFSSGMRDATAIRYFAKMFYDRGQATNNGPKHLLLFGDGTYDHRNKVSNGNYVMTYQVESSENHIDALVTDDFFGVLDDNEAFASSDLMDIGVGRLLISSNQIANEQVNKVEHYMKNGSNFYSNPGVCDCNPSQTTNTFGDWRLKYVQIADDPDMSLSYDFVNQDLEPQVQIVNGYRKEMNVDKIYSDAFQQVSTAGGQRYPTVNEAIDDRIRRGVLLVNYVGHGGEVGVADERIITVPQINDWKNANAFALIVSATCEFTKYDDPDRVSAGEWASLNPNGGAIALMTTTRSVYFNVNQETGVRFYQQVFKRDTDSLPSYFGDIMMKTKNTVTSGGNNKRSFTLIGDPALRLAMPRLKIKADSIYREGSGNISDTVRALDKITLVGHVEDLSGNLLSSFKGVVSPTIFDKPKTEYTLAQDPGTWVVPYQQQKNALFKGQASVNNGYFKMTFIVPKDIDYNIGYGKISMYGSDNTVDAMGYDKTVIIGGINPNGINDDRGPDIELYMNDYTFVDGGITDERPILLAKLFDSNGINAVGNGIGHDITAVVDQNSAKPIVLNDYYLADLDTYMSGTVNFNMSQIAPGPHTLTFKAWDVNNNSSERTIDFVVKAKELPELSHVLNYPNPFTTSTKFFFEHNQVNTALESQIQIFTVSGKLVKTINTLVNTQGFRSEGIAWDGKDDFGDQLAKGVYVYRLSIKTDNGGKAEKIEKLVILK